MPLHPTWQDIAVRLALTVFAGLVIGVNRTQRGQAAGMRTTLLICLTASLSMILPNLLLDSRGKAGDSFVVLDLMRFPLGVLSGIGFIGAGTILRRNDLVTGVTTAATMWFVTMLGMCLGAGELALGMVSLAIAAAVLWVLKRVEKLVARENEAMLTVWFPADAPQIEADVRGELKAARYSVTSSAVAVDESDRRRCVKLLVCWRTRRRDDVLPPFLDDLARRADVLKLRWEPAGFQFDGDKK